MMYVRRRVFSYREFRPPRQTIPDPRGTLRQKRPPPPLTFLQAVRDTFQFNDVTLALKEIGKTLTHKVEDGIDEMKEGIGGLGGYLSHLKTPPRQRAAATVPSSPSGS